MTEKLRILKISHFQILQLEMHCTRSGRQFGAKELQLEQENIELQTKLANALSLLEQTNGRCSEIEQEFGARYSKLEQEVVLANSESAEKVRMPILPRLK